MSEDPPPKKRSRAHEHTAVDSLDDKGGVKPATIKQNVKKNPKKNKFQVSTTLSCHRSSELSRVLESMFLFCQKRYWLYPHSSVLWPTMSMFQVNADMGETADSRMASKLEVLFLPAYPELHYIYMYICRSTMATQFAQSRKFMRLQADNRTLTQRIIGVCIMRKWRDVLSHLVRICRWARD